MKGGTTNPCETKSRELSELQAEVLDELQLKGEDGVTAMYLRALKSLKTRLIMDDDYEPNENLSLARVVTMIEHDLEVLGGRALTSDESIGL